MRLKLQVWKLHVIIAHATHILVHRRLRIKANQRNYDFAVTKRQINTYTHSEYSSFISPSVCEEANKYLHAAYVCVCFFKIYHIILTLHLDNTIWIIYACRLLLVLYCRCATRYEQTYIHAYIFMLLTRLMLRSTWVFALELLSALKAAYFEAHFSACALYCSASVLLPKVLRIWIELFAAFS